MTETNASTPSVGVVIPSYKGRKLLPRLIPLLQASSIPLKILVIDSSSNDGTVEYLAEAGVECIVIAQKDFNHGGTREMGRKHLGCDITVMMTQDVIPTGNDTVEKLIAPIVRGDAAVAYARQIPHDNAGFFEAFPRHYNYPAESQLRGLEDAPKYGVYTFFCSDTCAAWSSVALEDIGGLPHTMSLEDTIATAALLRAGHRIAYAADAVVKHSHNYTLKQEFDRYYVTGYVRDGYKDALFIEGGDEKRGAGFVAAMIKHLLRHNPLLIPYAILSSGVKFIGYKYGARRHQKGLPQ